MRRQPGVGDVVLGIGMGLLLLAVFAWNELLVSLLFSWARPPWSYLALLVLPAAIALGYTRPGERLMVAISGGRSPSQREAEAWGPVLEATREQTGYPGRLTLWVSDEVLPNAFAQGAGQVCVTQGLGALAEDEQEAVLAHELGHIAGRHAALSQAVYIVTTLGSLAGAALGLLFGLVASLFDAMTESASRGVVRYVGWLAVGIFVALNWVVNWATQLAWLAYRRRMEYQADDYAAEHGYAEPLARALEVLHQAAGPRPRGLAVTLWSDHPHAEHRIARLLAHAELEA